ncbi:MAG TPA: lipid-binding SYLF domain-containing protein [Candidatus Methylomirabilis sp.]|nr:lipid-binding SYLF domain-containing protein [Candidatus Methylomirabilis sp.]
MTRRPSLTAAALTLSMMFAASAAPRTALAQGIDPASQAALNSLYSLQPEARTLASKAKAILIFPQVGKAGFIVGAQYGKGQLIKGGSGAGHYNIAAGSYGLQAGVQAFAYAMFFMTDSALAYLENSAGFEVGVGPSIVVVDAGKAKTLTTTTGREDVYAFIFGQKGLMAGLGLQGSKITRTGP